jgi:hypothetical protein
MKRTFLVLVAAFMLLSTSTTAFAQDTTPVPGPEAAKHLPSAKLLGKGWVLSNTVSPDTLSPYSFTMSPDVFREGAAGIYLGPQGAQVVFVSLLITTNRVAIRQSWDDANKLVNGIGLFVNQDYSGTSDLEGQDPPKGCVEAARTIGSEQFIGLPVGSTICAIDPDGILVAITVGTVSGNTGTTAADAVIESAINKTAVVPAETPTPTS